MCRQVMREFFEGEVWVVLFCAGDGHGGEEGEGEGEWQAEKESEGEAGYVVMTMGELLPMSFGPDMLPAPGEMEKIQKGG